MNAYELADFVEISKPNDKTHQAIATMLRQQQAEIEALKESVEMLKHAYCQRDNEVKKLKDEAKKAEQFYLDAFDRGKQIGYAEGMISRKAQEK